jgi:hypothetical protein
MIESSRNTANAAASATIRTDNLTKVCAGADVRAFGEFDITVTVGDSLTLAAHFDAVSQLDGAEIPLPGLDQGPASPTPPSRLTEGL